jgi:two-component system phosphate regulon sensor histidine kinase PhoR
VRVAARDDAVVLEVSDRGIGIPRSEHARVFDRFYRAERQLGKGGYGLGLFLVKHIVNAHGGSIELESEPRLGSTFRLVFPTATSALRQE